MRKLRAFLHDERGTSTTLEVILWAVPLFAMFTLMLIGTRAAAAQHTVQSAATVAVRAATLSTGADGGEAAALEAATVAFSNSDIDCTATTIELDTSPLSLPIGQSGIVTANVSCTISVAHLTLIPGTPGTYTLSADASSPTDAYTER